nr:hypothetical protein [Nostoc sp. ChiQUE02]MDZ8232484.1 hypothetical protein [Nostoc sp. ChiQUE02]
MKATSLITPSHAILGITTLGILTASPILLAIAFLGFCFDRILDEALLSSLKTKAAIQDLYTEHLEDQLAAKKSNE